MSTLTVVEGDPPIRRGEPFESLPYIDKDAGLLLSFFFNTSLFRAVRRISTMSLWISVSFSLIFPLRTSGVQLELRTRSI